MAKGQVTRTDLTGKKFNRLTVVAFDRIDKNRQARWWVKCDCGKVFSTLGNSLMRNLTKSCGCLKLENLIKSNRWKNPPHTIKHGHAVRGTFSKEYKAWQNMLNRCRNENTPYHKNYGGRGITLEEPRWIKFEEFLKDVGPAPSLRHSLDRKDNNKGYGPKNVRWATKEQQVRNTRTNVMITFNGRRQCLEDWATETGVSRAALNYRLKEGWTIEATLTTPIRKYKPR